MLPYAFGLPLLALLITSAVRGHPSLVLLGGAIGAVALVILRQFLTLRDNLALLVRAANFDDLTGLGLWSETERVINLAREMHQALADAGR